MKSLYGEFKPKPKKGSTLLSFVDKNTGLRMECSQSIKLNGRKYKPDVAVYKNDKLIAVVAKKIYQVNRKAVTDELDKIRELGKRALLVFYEPPTERTKKGVPSMRKILDTFKQKIPNFDYLILKDNTDKIYPYFLKLISEVQRSD